ncbi:hypothetical protein Tco_0644666 [Tanacetum coccineum]
MASESLKPLGMLDIHGMEFENFKVDGLTSQQLTTLVIDSHNTKSVIEEDDPLDDDDDSVIGEDEEIWALRLFLPYINEFLLKVKALFSGDPATTMKLLSIALEMEAKCGQSIWEGLWADEHAYGNL